MERKDISVKYEKISNKGFDIKLLVNEGFVVQEKLDGANASYTIEDNKLKCYSRNFELNENNTLKGFYNLVQSLYDDIDNELKDFLKDNIIFGEWLVPHTVKYKEKYLNKFYIFDIYNKSREEYVSYDELKEGIKLLEKYNNIHRAKDLLIVTHEDMKDLNNRDLDKLQNKIKMFVGYSDYTITEEIGEGVIVKTLKSRKVSKSFKLVNDEFKESRGIKHQDVLNVRFNPILDNVTEARIRKIINKFIDDDFISKEEVSMNNFSNIMKLLVNELLKDIKEEEINILLNKWEKEVKKIIPVKVKEVILNFEDY